MKIDQNVVDCIFIGYAHNNVAYRFLVHKSEIIVIHVNTIMDSRNTIFLRNIIPKNQALLNELESKMIMRSFPNLNIVRGLE